jgi:hypothetical protein
MEANDHAFSHEARNWGWAQYWRRNDAYYSNPSVCFSFFVLFYQIPLLIIEFSPSYSFLIWDMLYHCLLLILTAIPTALLTNRQSITTPF